MFEIIGIILFWVITLLVQGAILALAASWVYHEPFNIKKGMIMAIVLFAIYVILALLIGGFLGISLLLTR